MINYFRNISFIDLLIDKQQLGEPGMEIFTIKEEDQVLRFFPINLDRQT